MDQQLFDHVTAAVASGTGRRRALAGMLAGTAASLGWGIDTTAKKRKKKCKKANLCPQRGCCSCTVNFMSATKCSLIERTSVSDFIGACEAFCSPDAVFDAKFQLADRVHFCAPGDQCTQVLCPLPL